MVEECLLDKFMEYTIPVAVVLIIFLVVVAPVLLFRPLVNSVADRIAGKRPGAKELEELKKRVIMLEGEVNEMRTKYEALEESQDFSRKLLEDWHTNKSAPEPEKTEEKLKSIEIDSVENPN